MNLILHVAILQCPRVRTQARLAKVTGIREDRVSRIVHEWVHATADEKQRIATALGRAPGALFRRRPTTEARFVGDRRGNPQIV